MFSLFSLSRHTQHTGGKTSLSTHRFLNLPWWYSVHVTVSSVTHFCTLCQKTSAGRLGGSLRTTVLSRSECVFCETRSFFLESFVSFVLLLLVRTLLISTVAILASKSRSKSQVDECIGITLRITLGARLSARIPDFVNFNGRVPHFERPTLRLENICIMQYIRSTITTCSQRTNGYDSRSTKRKARQKSDVTYLSLDFFTLLRSFRPPNDPSLPLTYDFHQTLLF